MFSCCPSVGQRSDVRRARVPRPLGRRCARCSPPPVEPFVPVRDAVPRAVHGADRPTRTTRRLAVVLRDVRGSAKLRAHVDRRGRGARVARTRHGAAGGVVMSSEGFGRGKRGSENTPKTHLAHGAMRAHRVLDLHADRHAPQEHGHVLRVHVRVALRVLLEAHDVRLVQDHEQDHDGLVIRETTRLAHGAPRARRVPDREAVPAEPQRQGDDEEALGRVAAPFFFSRFTMVPSYSPEYRFTYRFTYTSGRRPPLSCRWPRKSVLSFAFHSIAA